MSPFRTWKALTRASPTRSRLIGALLALVMMACLLTPTALAAEPVQVLRSEASYTFSDSIDFELELRSQQTVEHITLFYGIDGKPLLRRIYPAYSPGNAIVIEHLEELDAGQFAPGQTLRYFWRIELADGLIVETPVGRFVYQDDRFDWRTLSGAIIDLHYYGTARKQAADLLVTAQEAQARLSQDVGVATDRRLQIYLYNSAREMSGALAQRSAVYDSRVTTLGVAVSEDTLLLLGADNNVELTIAHELSHLIVGLATDNPYAGLPRWLDEGLAMYAEGQLPRANRLALERAVRDDTLLSIRSMSSYSGQAEQVDLYYGAAYSIVDYMLHAYGRDKMRTMLRVFSQGALQEDALRQVYGFGLAELDTAWRASLGLGPRPAPAAEPATPVKNMSPWSDVGIRVSA